MKTDTNKQNPTHEIRQNGKAVLRSDCECSLPMIFNNLTGRNIPDARQYNVSIRFTTYFLEVFENIWDKIWRN